MNYRSATFSEDPQYNHKQGKIKEMIRGILQIRNVYWREHVLFISHINETCYYISCNRPEEIKLVLYNFWWSK